LSTTELLDTLNNITHLHNHLSAELCTAIGETKVNNRKINVMYLTNLIGRVDQVGGAEQQLLELVKGIDKSRFNPILVTLSKDSFIEEVKRIPDVETLSVDMKNKYDFTVLVKIFMLLRQKRIDIVQPFLTPATLFGLLPALINRTPIKIATERGGRIIGEKFGAKLYRKTQDFLTRFTDAVVPNSEAGREYLIERGIHPAKIQVIYNGINANRLMPDQEKVKQIKSELNLPPDGFLVGMTSRLRPDKDYPTFIKGAGIIHQSMPQARLPF
jgi:glycosyltransferase involved in cell wall biosynthesis